MCCPQGLFDTGLHSPRVTEGQGFFNHGYIGYRLHAHDNKYEHDHSIEQIQYPADDYSLVATARHLSASYIINTTMTQIVAEGAIAIHYATRVHWRNGVSNGRNSWNQAVHSSGKDKPYLK